MRKVELLTNLNLLTLMCEFGLIHPFSLLLCPFGSQDFWANRSIYQAKGQGALWTGCQSVAGLEFGLSICKSLPTPLTVLSLNCISLQTQNIEKKRDAVVCCLINYLGERQDDLFHDCQVCHIDNRFLINSRDPPLISTFSFCLPLPLCSPFR